MTRVTSPTPRSSVTLFSEMLKLSLALVITLTSDAPPTKNRRPDGGLLPPGAVGYLAVNNVRYFMLEQVNPGLMAIVWNLKICRHRAARALPPFRRAFTRFQRGRDGARRRLGGSPRRSPSGARPTSSARATRAAPSGWKSSPARSCFVRPSRRSTPTR